MKTNLIFFLVLFSLISSSATAQDTWWDDSWPYRIPVSASGAGIVEATVDFGPVLNELGLNQGLLDLRSIRVVSCINQGCSDPILYKETYSIQFEDADEPKIGFQSDGFFWFANDGVAIADTSRLTQGNSHKCGRRLWLSGCGT